MAVEPDQRTAAQALEALADAAAFAAGTERADQALRAVAAAAARATGADVAIVRIREEDELVTAAVIGPGAVAAQLEGSRVPLGDEDAPAQAAERLGSDDVVALALDVAGDTGGRLELYRGRGVFSATERAAAEAAAAQAALVLSVVAARRRGETATDADRAVELVGEALAAGGDPERAAEHVARVGVKVASAQGALLWRCGAELELLARTGEGAELDEAQARAAAARALEQGATAVEELNGRVGVSLRLGEPPLGVLQLVYAREAAPPPEELDRLGQLGVRAAHALRNAERTQQLADELEEARALLATMAEANAQLSLAHALEAGTERIAEIVGTQRIAVYLRDEGRLVAAAERALAGPHSRVGEALLELALGPLRGRGLVYVPDAGAEPRLVPVRDAVTEAGIEAAVALPLVVADEVIGLLAAYPSRGRAPDPNEAALLSALAGQLAVAAQNARLHEESTRLAGELEHALASERDAARRLRALYDISRSFAQTLSLDVTLDAVVKTVVEHLDVDAAVIRMPDPRREVLLPRALHVADERLGKAVRSILFRPQPFAHPATEQVFRNRTPLMLDQQTAPLLAPFLAKGSTAAVIPIATPAEVIATLTLVSLQPARPIDRDLLDAAMTIGAQAALAIENARLYQQQKDFADAMQRSLLPQVRPPVAGLDVGEIYASSARVDVGGDLYDYMTLEGGWLAVVLGDVTGHGIDAAADMAMAKFVFRSLAREHPQPGDFLAAANNVVVDEIAPGKFITMLYLLVNPATGRVTCASAGHPSPRLVREHGDVTELAARGLALGVDSGQEYVAVDAQLEPGDSVVLYTDGVVEARNESEFFGIERLDALLSRRRERGAEDLAASVIQAARRFTGGELLDDCAVVVVKRKG